jgi:hypothetical protein
MVTKVKTGSTRPAAAARATSRVGRLGPRGGLQGGSLNGQPMVSPWWRIPPSEALNTTPVSVD